MADIGRIRQEVRRVARADRFSGEPEFDEFALGSLISAFNYLAPQNMGLPTEGLISLEVAANNLSGPLRSHQQAQIETAFARAIAFVGASIANPSDDVLRASEVLLAQTPIFTRPTPSGAIALIPERLAGIPGIPGESRSERAMQRLAEILPHRGEDSSSAMLALLALRQPEARALGEVAAVASSMLGLSVLLRGSDEPIEAAMPKQLAEELTDSLSDMSEDVLTLPPVKGRLDGMRFRRQMFYLVLANDNERQGVVDAALLGKARELLDKPVIATLQRVTKIKADGTRMRASFRLVDVELDEPAPGLLD